MPRGLENLLAWLDRSWGELSLWVTVVVLGLAASFAAVGVVAAMASYIGRPLRAGGGNPLAIFVLVASAVAITGKYVDPKTSLPECIMFGFIGTSMVFIGLTIGSLPAIGLLALASWMGIL